VPTDRRRGEIRIIGGFAPVRSRRFVRGTGDHPQVVVTRGRVGAAPAQSLRQQGRSLLIAISTARSSNKLN